METSELLKKVRKIEIKTRGLSKQIFSGKYHSTFKGKGMAFSEVREYQFGDDIRNIDWNVTARFNHPYVKVFEEERELNVILMIDVSASSNFGTRLRLKRDLITELSAVLAFSAIQNNDKIGVIFFSDIIEKYIPPKKGRNHILRIISEMINFKPKSTKTDIAQAIRYMTNVVKKRSIVFVVSDFIGDNFIDAMSIANRKHDVVAVRIYDEKERELPRIGLVNFLDLESGEKIILDTSNNDVREEYFKYWQNFDNILKHSLNQAKIDLIQIRTDESYIKPLINFFKLRERRY